MQPVSKEFSAFINFQASVIQAILLREGCVIEKHVEISQIINPIFGQMALLASFMDDQPKYNKRSFVRLEGALYSKAVVQRYSARADEADQKSSMQRRADNR